MKIWVDREVNPVLLELNSYVMKKSFTESRKDPKKMPGHPNTIGSQKPLGYLLVEENIVKFHRSTPDAMIDEASKNGVSAELLSNTWLYESPVNAVYFWDNGNLGNLLNSRAEKLNKYNWPTDTKDFVNTCATKRAEKKTELFDIVADAHGDYLNADRLYIEKEHLAEKEWELGIELRENKTIPGAADQWERFQGLSKEEKKQAINNGHELLKNVPDLLQKVHSITHELGLPQSRESSTDSSRGSSPPPQALSSRLGDLSGVTRSSGRTSPDKSQRR
jgi:hypothetical protein